MKFNINVLFMASENQKIGIMVRGLKMSKNSDVFTNFFNPQIAKTQFKFWPFRELKK